MKRIFNLLPLLLIGCASTFEPLPKDQSQLIIIQEIPDLSKNEIYDKTLLWVASKFVDSKEVLEIQDKENGLIVGKGIAMFSLSKSITAPTRFTMKIDIKDGRYRIKFNNLIWISETGNRPLSTVGYKQYNDEVFNYLKTFAESLKSALSDKDEW